MNALNTGLIRVSRPNIALMLLCGIAATASIGAASAAAPDDNVPSIALRYDPHSLDTESGARVLYRRIVNAAAVVCPNHASNTLIIPAAIRECREQSVARAVFKINNSKLVAVYASTSKRG
jgi:UrcA family protein